MTIRRGEPWGSEVPRPPDLRVATDDADLARLIASSPGGTYTVGAGDLHRALGSPRTPPTANTVWRVPIDLLEVDLGDRTLIAVSHVLIRDRGWFGRIAVVTNAGHLGDWNVAPRAHPNDGRFDVVDVERRMRLRDRWEARRRLPTGGHVPHPAISVRTATDWTWHGERPAAVRIDGRDVGRHRSVAVRCRPDAVAIHF